MEELVSFGLQKLWDQVSQEYELFQGVDDQVTKLKRDFNLLKSFLKDADAKKHTSATVKNYVEEIKEIVWDAEDIIETYILKDDLGKNGGIKKRIRRLAFIIPERREIALEIGAISNRISQVISDMESFGIQRIIVEGGGDMQSVHDSKREMRKTFSKDHESDLVGLEANVKKLVGYLVEEDNIQVVSITGMGGLGKTTLARQAFNHESVKNKYDRLAWVCVSDVFTRKNVWQTILGNLSPKDEQKNISEMTEDTLQGELFRLLETSKPLIVLDDIWKQEDWDQLSQIFPPKKGWKVLLTSPYEIAAGSGHTSYVNLKPECLTREHSWTLFQRIAFPSNDASELKLDEEMEEMGKQMVKHCGGLPLAIKVLGGLLAKKYIPHEWKRILDNIGSHIVGATNSSDNNNSWVYHVLSLSFEELPSNLKHCFLYLAHFPEDYEINIEKLSYYWAAEGIPKSGYYEGASIRDVADGYIEELVSRNMIISQRDTATMRFKACHLHDMMREMCLRKAKEDNFLHIASTTNTQSTGTSRRLALQHPTKLLVESYLNNPKLRSLLVVMDRNEGNWKVPGSSVTRLEQLRVLDFFKVWFNEGKLPSSIGKLIHLRYLSFEKAYVRELPFSLGNLKLLIYLNLDVRDGLCKVPNVFMGMRELRYLVLPLLLHRYNKKKLELSNLLNLETMMNFSLEHCSLEDLHGMTRLKSLSVSLAYGSKYIESLSAVVGAQRNLEDVFLVNSVGRAILRYTHGKQLLWKIRLPRLPDAQHFPSHLTKITLEYCELVVDPMPVLEKFLQLKEVVFYSADTLRRMVCSGRGFPQLQKLTFSVVFLWNEWIVEEGSMPLLHTLIISSCKRLEELPDGLRFITSLKEMRNVSMGTEWKKRLSEGGEDYYKIQHIPSVTFEEDDD